MWRVKEIINKAGGKMVIPEHDAGNLAVGWEANPDDIAELRKIIDQWNADLYKPGDRVCVEHRGDPDRFGTVMSWWRDPSSNVTRVCEYTNTDGDSRAIWLPAEHWRIRHCTPEEIAEHWPEPEKGPEPEPRFLPGQFVTRNGRHVFRVNDSQGDFLLHISGWPHSTGTESGFPAHEYRLATATEISNDSAWGPSYKQPERTVPEKDGPYTVTNDGTNCLPWIVKSGGTGSQCFATERTALNMAWLLNFADKQRTGGGDVPITE